MTAPASVKTEILELRPEIRPSLDRAGLQSIYRDLVAEASAAYVLRRSLLSSRFEQIDVHALDSESNFKLAMSGEKLVVVLPLASQVPAGLLRHYPVRSADIPPRLKDLAANASSLIARERGGPVSAYMFLHDLEAILLLQLDQKPA